LTAYRQWAHLIPRTENERDADREGGSNAGYCHAKRYNRALDLSPGARHAPTLWRTISGFFSVAM